MIDDPIQPVKTGPTGRGRLRVYIGMAAGVGKTYRMLDDARGDLLRSHDVVIGYLEHHGRAETESLAEGFEAIPLLSLQHQGIVVREFNLDAALERQPKIILLDELAHSNAIGCRHAKRWQDAEELLQRGIEVRTTVNIQHIESLHDVVAQITGVFVKESVPDSFFELADEIELIDLSPDELQLRIKEGKVYRSDKVDQALSGFFKRQNLLALRELSLRQVADRVDDEVRKSRTLVDASETWHTSGRILVCIAPNRMASRVVRAAKRLAVAQHSELHAIWVDSPRQNTVGEAGRVEANEAARLAESLGIKVVTLAAEDIVNEVLQYARAENISTIVMGKPIRPRWKELLFGSVVDVMIRKSGSIDVLVITGEESHGSTLPKVTLGNTDTGYRWGLVFSVLVGCTVIGFLMMPHFDKANIIMVYLIGLVVIAAKANRLASLVAAAIAVLVFDFSFVPPRGSFEVSDAQYLITFGVMMLVALTITSLAGRLKDERWSAIQRERSTFALYQLSRRLADARIDADMAKATVEELEKLTLTPVTVLVRSPELGVRVLAQSSNGFENDPKEKAVAQWVIDHQKAAGAGTDTLAGGDAFYVPILTSKECSGAIGMLVSKERPFDARQLHLIDTFSHQLGGALERYWLARESHESTLKAETESLRSNLLSAVSHDLRTPLAAIAGAASSLLERKPSADESGALIRMIKESSDRMGDLIRNLLDMTRIQGGGVDLKFDWYALDELIANAIDRTSGMFKTPVKLDCPPQSQLVHVDGLLVEQVFVNLLENAARHGGENPRVVIRIAEPSEVVRCEVTDNGPGIPEASRSLVFERFHRSSNEGFGLGLAICKAVMDAHKGKIWIESAFPHGAKFVLEFPKVEEVA